MRYRRIPVRPGTFLGFLFGLVMALSLVSGCDRNVEPYLPGEKPAAPDLSHIFPEAAQRSSPPSGTPRAAQRGGGMAPGSSRAGSGPSDAAPPIRGTVVVAPELSGRVPAGAVLFLIARREGGGPPVAVRRIPSPRFPLSFELGPDDRMIRTIPFAGPLRLSAKLDTDGNATTRTPGDLRGQADRSYEPGSEAVKLVLDEVL